MASSQMWLFCFRNYLLLTLVLVSSGHNIQKRGEPLSRGKQESLTLTMPGAEPSGHDSYLCTAFKVSKLTGSKEKIFVTGFQPENAVADKAHHMMLHTCTNPPKVRKQFSEWIDLFIIHLLT